MNMLNGIQNFLHLVNANWTTILVILGLSVGIVQKIQDYWTKSDEEKIEIAKAQIKETLLTLVSDAEMDYGEWNKTGSIKRSQVINELFDKYPVLSRALNQKELIQWMDHEIDSSLQTLRGIIDKQWN
ncbi:MAG: hypothetical protein HFG96_12460 [Lachnospiraceae bacterium]|nr:hypothetical protein [Lachnospiraceae bacterium]